jgi:DNA modification methylase
MHTSKQITGFSGTTGVACKNLNRNFILIEKEESYCKIAEERIKNIPIKLI